MSKFFFKRLIKEDFPSKYLDLLGKLLFPYNETVDQLNKAFSNGLSLKDNANVQEVDLGVVAPVNATNPVFFRSTLRGSCRGITCIKADVVGTGTAPTSQPFFTFDNSDSTNIKVTSVTGLTSGTRYILRILCYGP